MGGPCLDLGGNCPSGFVKDAGGACVALTCPETLVTSYESTSNANRIKGGGDSNDGGGYNNGCGPDFNARLGRGEHGTSNTKT